jgi:Protein of unknown function (DUF3352)
VTKAIDDRRLRLGLLAASVVMIAVSIAVIATRHTGGSDKAPQNEAAQLVGRDALIYVHLSTDGDRDAVRRATDTLRTFPGANRVRDDLIKSVGGTPTGSDAADIGEWLGKEVALALLPTRGERSDVLLALESTDRDKTERYLRLRLSEPIGQITVRGTTLRNYSGLWVAWVGDFLTLGSFDGISKALALHAGQGEPLADNEAYRRVTDDLPKDRVADAYARPAGLRGVLVPRGGLLGLVGSLADRQALVAIGAGLAPSDNGAELVARSLTAVGGPRIAPFTPTLLDAVPADALALLATNSPGTAIPRALDFAGGAGDAFKRLAADLERRTGVDLEREIAPLLGLETVVFVRRSGTLAPVFTLVAQVRSENAARERLARLQAPLAKLARRDANGRVPAFRTRRVGGLEAFELELRPGLRVAYTLEGGRLIVSTSVAGILAALHPAKPITDSDALETVLSDRPQRVTSLLFLDFSQLLGLGEQSGLADDPRYARSRADLRRIRSIGAASSTEGNLTTLELSLEIP